MGRPSLPATPDAWLAQMMDAKKNGAAFKDPAAFAEWLDAITEPRFMTALASVAADPATYPRAMADAIDPEAARNWSEFTDPQLYLRWMLASANPSFQQAIISKFSDPAKMKRWLEAASRPEAYGPVLATMGSSPAAWAQAPFNEASYAPITKLMQPATPFAWFGTMAGGMGQQAAGQKWLMLPADKMPEVTPANGARYRY